MSVNMVLLLFYYLVKCTYMFWFVEPKREFLGCCCSNNTRDYFSIENLGVQLEMNSMVKSRG